MNWKDRRDVLLEMCGDIAKPAGYEQLDKLLNDRTHDEYKKDPQKPVWVEEGLVTQKGTVVLFLTRFENGQRAGNSQKDDGHHPGTNRLS